MSFRSPLPGHHRSGRPESACTGRLIGLPDVEEWQVAARYQNHLLARHFERQELGTSFPDVARHPQSLPAAALMKHGGVALLYLTATGIDPSLVDLIRQRPIYGKTAHVYFNHGNRRIHVDHRGVRLRKAFLVTRLQTLIQLNRGPPPSSEETRTLPQDLLGYVLGRAEDANHRYEAFNVGRHEDQVTVLERGPQG